MGDLHRGNADERRFKGMNADIQREKAKPFSALCVNQGRAEG
jgi:hypothetical protein